MKRILLLCALCTLCFSAQATRPLKRALTYKQSDGTSITVYRQGHSGFAFYTTDDGVALLRNAKGDFCYTRLEGSDLQLTDELAHNAALRTANERTFVANNAAKEASAFTTLQRRYAPSLKGTASTSDGLGTYGKRSNGTVPSIGEITVPVIMVEFPDRPFLEATTPEKVTRIFNEENYADEAGCVGSVADYFKSQSNGLFKPEFKVVAQVKTSKGYADYGRNNGASLDTGLVRFLHEVIDSAATQGVDFSQYIVSGSGLTKGVPCLVFYFAGPGEHSSYEEGCEDYIWAQWNTLGYYTNGTRINSYFVGNETLQNYTVEGTEDNPIYIPTGSQTDGIGVFCHEFGHALGLPDFYNVNNSTAFPTMELWSVMDYGQYFSNGYAPVGYNAYERSYMGWLNVKTLGSAGEIVRLHPFSEPDSINAVRIVNNSVAAGTEYFLIENRQAGTWYPSTMGHGLLVTHVDYLSTSWSSNKVNINKNRQRFSYVPADGEKQAYTGRLVPFRSDLFPGTDGISEILQWEVFTGTLEAPIYQIEENEEGIVQFKYLDPTLAVSTIRTDEVGSDIIYTADGRRVAGTNLPSRAGVYIIRSDSGTRKVLIGNR